jgi:hypothetical protein
MNRRCPRALIDEGALRGGCVVAGVVWSRNLSRTSRMAVCDGDVVGRHELHVSRVHLRLG